MPPPCNGQHCGPIPGVPGRQSPGSHGAIPWLTEWFSFGILFVKEPQESFKTMLLRPWTEDSVSPRWTLIQ